MTTTIDALKEHFKHWDLPPDLRGLGLKQGQIDEEKYWEVIHQLVADPMMDYATVEETLRKIHIDFVDLKFSAGASGHWRLQAATRSMHILNVLLDGHGVGALFSRGDEDGLRTTCSDTSDELVCLHIEVGDLYAPTLIWDADAQQIILGTVGDFMSDWQKEQDEKVRADVLEGMTRTIFVLGWISCEEDKPGGESWLSDHDRDELQGLPEEMQAFDGASLCGVEMFDIAPSWDGFEDEPRYGLARKQARWYAEHLAHAIEETREEGGDWRIWALRADAMDDLMSWGHYLVMQAVGSGVRWTDDHASVGVPHVPSLELHGYDGWETAEDASELQLQIEACGYLPRYEEKTEEEE